MGEIQRIYMAPLALSRNIWYTERYKERLCAVGKLLLSFIIYHFFSVVQYPPHFLPGISGHSSISYERNDLPLDNRNQQNIPRRRQDSISPEQRRGMQQGYPVRDDATLTINRPVNRPSGPREVPPAMRQGKIPVRQNANTGRTYPVMNRGSQAPTGTQSPLRQENRPQNSAQQKPVRQNPAPGASTHKLQDALHTTQEFPRVTAPAPHTGKGTHTPPAGLSSRKLWILPLAIAILAALGLCIGIPAALSAEPDALPDFDMSADYDSTTEEPAGMLEETAGVGREEAVETETEPPETEPPVVKFPVTLTFYDREPITVSTAEITLGDLLEQVGYTVQNSDMFPLDLTTLLTEETTIAVDTIEYRTLTETITLPYSTKVNNVQTIPRGQKNVVQYGQNGTKTITYTTKVINGVETERSVASEEITKYPVDEIYDLGVGGTLVGNDGKTYSYSYYHPANATYYDIEGLTYLGYNADESVVAVDMDYIPLGTKLYVKNDQFDFGVRTAADTGSMIEGWEVDIWLSDSNPQKAAFAQIGYMDMDVYFLD